MSLFGRNQHRDMEPHQLGLFEKVSFEQFKEDWIKLYGDETVTPDVIQAMYDQIKLPIRGTTKSAGYDFFAPFGFSLAKGENIVIPTGIRAYMDNDVYLALHPRSGMGFKSRVMLANTTGIIDADYWESDNEGHIMVKLCYDGIEPSNKIAVTDTVDRDNITFETVKPSSTEIKDLKVNMGDRFVQGIFNTYGITDDDDATGQRNGGEGSTGN